MSKTANDELDDQLDPDEVDETDGTDETDETDEEAINTAALTPANVDVATPKPVPAEPSSQMRRLGGKFLALGTDLKLFYVLTMQQVGTPMPRVETVKKVVDKEVKDTETGEVSVKKVEVEEQVTLIDYVWGDAQQYGNPYASLTAALRAQAEYAKSFRKEAYEVKEYLSKEYGVWYVTDPKNPTRNGMRFSVAVGERKPVSEKAPSKPKKTDEEKAAEKAARDAERAKTKAAKDAERAEKKALADATRKAKADAKAAKATSTPPPAIEPTVAPDDIAISDDEE